MTDLPFIGPVDPPSLHVMSYNIRRRMRHFNPRSPDLWAHRKPLLARLLENEKPTVLGAQEALPDQAGFVRRSLGKRYGVVGYGRQQDRRGEGCPIFYDRDRLLLLGWEQTALSDTPQVQASSTWGNRVPRVVVDARFRDLVTGREFQVVNTHFDHVSRSSRLRSAERLRQIVAGSGLPAIVTGDFNTDVGSGPYDVLVGSGLLRDSWYSAAERLSAAWGTFLDYTPPVRERKRIDWILTSPDVTVDQVGINVVRYQGGWPSDHVPVQAVLHFGRRGRPRARGSASTRAPADRAGRADQER
ncbi:endonuclease/exonuclease/phosphatase family protein [soil metagenome]